MMGNFSLTLIDSIDMQVVLGDKDGFSNAIQQVLSNVHNFDLDVRIQVFEVTIRILGALLSAHMLHLTINLDFIWIGIKGSYYIWR